MQVSQGSTERGSHQLMSQQQGGPSGDEGMPWLQKSLSGICMVVVNIIFMLVPARIEIRAQENAEHIVAKQGYTTQ